MTSPDDSRSGRPSLRSTRRPWSSSPSNVPATSPSAVRQLGGTGSLEEVTWRLVAGLERELEHLGDLAYAAAAYRELSVHRSGDRIVCRVGEETVEGAFVEIDDQGRLVLDNGQRLSSGEVIS